MRIIMRLMYIILFLFCIDTTLLSWGFPLFILCMHVGELMTSVMIARCYLSRRYGRWRGSLALYYSKLRMAICISPYILGMVVTLTVFWS